jgi:hypothetical protein
MRTTARRSQRGLSIRGSWPGLAGCRRHGARRERADGCEVRPLPMRCRETTVGVCVCLCVCTYRGVAGAETVRVQVVCGEAAVRFPCSQQQWLGNGPKEGSAPARSLQRRHNTQATQQPAGLRVRSATQSLQRAPSLPRPPLSRRAASLVPSRSPLWLARPITRLPSAYTLPCALPGLLTPAVSLAALACLHHPRPAHPLATTQFSSLLSIALIILPRPNGLP